MKSVAFPIVFAASLLGVLLPVITFYFPILRMRKPIGRSLNCSGNLEIVKMWQA